MEDKRHMSDVIRNKVEVTFDEYVEQQRYNNARNSFIRKCILLGAGSVIILLGLVAIALLLL